MRKNGMLLIVLLFLTAASLAASSVPCAPELKACLEAIEKLLDRFEGDAK